MERLLIVEDEKMIRRGLAVMARRAPVEIGEILECKNGLEALEILRGTHVDAVFTDVRMPGMDGLTLLREIQSFPDRPQVVIISGYDDFDYAVEAMRGGAKEYILKPVDRQRVFEVLQNLEKLRLKKKKDADKLEKIEDIGRQQLKYILFNPQIPNEELCAIRDAFDNLLVYGPYVVCCLNKKPAQYPGDAISLEGVGPFDVLVLRGFDKGFFSEKDAPSHVGMSGLYDDIDHFRCAFEQAVAARKYAFYLGRGLWEGAPPPYEGERLQTPQESEQLARQIGTREYGGMVSHLNSLFMQASRGLLRPEVFEGFLSRFLDAARDYCRGVLPEKDPPLEKLRAIYRYDTVDELRLALLEWLEKPHMLLLREQEGLRNRHRMQQALDYIAKNYAEGLNMAVVSNEISMNYSVFSQLFKEYTGKNFVDYLRDLRLAKARELLQTTDLRISEVAAQVGYENDKHFMKSFKAAVGVSPTEYRRCEQRRPKSSL